MHNAKCKIEGRKATIILSAVEKPHTFPLRYSPLNGEMSALALTEGSVCASKRVIPLTREMSSLRDKRMTPAVDEVFRIFPSVQ